MKKKLTIIKSKKQKMIINTKNIFFPMIKKFLQEKIPKSMKIKSNCSTI